MLEYRESLHNVGLVTGFQWLDGSFLENIEDLEGRPPNDIDVVTFFELPEGHTQATLWPHISDLFDVSHTKQRFRVDAYPSPLDGLVDENLIQQVAYWYSMWSHRRDGLWKGFVKVDLSPSGDQVARERLAARVATGFEQ